MAEPRVFLSFQHDDVPDVVGRLRDDLAAVFGGDNAYVGFEQIEFGKDFRTGIRKAILSADVMLLVIGPRFHLERLHTPDDFVRIEVEMALGTGIRVVPALVDGTTLPSPESLPPTLEAVAYQQVARLRPDPDFAVDVRRLIQSIRRLTTGTQPPAGRVVELGGGQAAAAVAAFEAPIGSLSKLVQDGAFALWDEEFVRNTIQQVLLWRERDEANPQIFELLIADVVKRVLDQLTDPAPLRGELLRLGADEYLADDIAGRITATVGSMTDLGDDDPRRDAELLERIAEATDRMAAAVEGSDLPKSLTRKAGEAAALGAAGAVGKAGADKGLHLLRESLGDEWSKLQVGLMIAWRAVRDLFVR